MENFSPSKQHSPIVYFIVGELTQEITRRIENIFLQNSNEPKKNDDTEPFN